MSIEAIIITALVGLLSALTGGMVAVSTARGQVANQVSEAWQKFNAPLQAELKELREKLHTYECGIELLLSQFMAAGISPVWRPGQEIPTLPEDTKPAPRRKTTGGLFG